MLTEKFVVGVGAQKAGTSSVASFLQNQGVNIHPRKELHAFNNPIRFVSRQEYLANFPVRKPGQWFGEFTPEYSLQVNALLNLKRILPNARVVYIYRNPIERLRSAFIHSLSVGVLPPKWTVDQFIDEAFFGQIGPWVNHALKHGQGDIVLTNLERVFDASAVRIIRFEDLVGAKQSSELEGLLGWLEIEPVRALNLPKQNTSKSYRSRASGKSKEQLAAEISEDRMIRLRELYDVTEKNMNAAGYKTEWF